jgi:3-hydroxybutyryl-CoA dehydratase
VTHYYEDLTVGLSESMTHTVTERDVELFGEATGDRNPLHFDEAYARKTVFRGRVAHGALSMGFISAVVGNKLPGPGSIFVSATINFKGPVRIGDTVTASCKVAEIGERRKVVLDCQCTVAGRVVVESQVVVLAPKKPGAP